MTQIVTQPITQTIILAKTITYIPPKTKQKRPQERERLPQQSQNQARRLQKQRVSFSLSNIYARFYDGGTIPSAHRAMGDVEALYRAFRKLFRSIETSSFRKR